MDPSDIVDQLAEITDVEEQMDVLEPLVQRLQEDRGVLNRDVGEALLQLMERCANDDDFGIYSTIEVVIDELDDRDELLRASVERRPMWKTIEMIGEDSEDIEALEIALQGDLDTELRHSVEDALAERREE